MLATPLQSQSWLTAYSLNIVDTFWRCVLGNYPVARWNWPQSSVVYRVWHGVAKSCDSFPSSMSLPLCTNFLFYHLQTITLPSPCLTDGIKHCPRIFSFVRSSVLSEDLNLDSSVHLLPVFQCPMSVLFCPSHSFLNIGQSEIWLFLGNSAMKSSILITYWHWCDDLRDVFILNYTLRYLSPCTIVHWGSHSFFCPC